MPSKQKWSFLKQMKMNNRGLVSLPSWRISEAEMKGEKTVTSRENTLAKNEKKEEKKGLRKRLFSAPIHWQLAYNVAGINGKDWIWGPLCKKN
jgi:hypothetical protein